MGATGNRFACRLAGGLPFWIPAGQREVSPALLESQTILISWFNYNVTLPFREPKRNRGLARRLRYLEQFEEMAPEKQRAIQEKRVRAMLEHAQTTCSYYSRACKSSGFRAADWHYGDPIRFPEVKRYVVRAEPEQLLSRAYSLKQLDEATTGGTTGTPTILWRDLEGLKDKTALRVHLNRTQGLEEGTPVMMIWGAERDLTLRPNWRWRFFDETLLRRTTINASELNESFYRKAMGALNGRRPDVIYGYAGSTARFAEWLRARNAPYHKPKRVIVTAETLSQEDRAILQDVFDCPVTEQYGSREIGQVATQCAYGRFHFHPYGCYLELTPAGQTPSGEMFKIVVTDLLNRGMPLIHYDTDDCALADDTPCSCGCWYPSVKTILGRSSDNLLLPDGTQIPAVALSVLWPDEDRGFKVVRQIQLVQKAMRRIHLRYAAHGEPARIEPELARIRGNIEAHFGVECEWTFERVPEIRRESSGKIRLCICEVVPENGGREAVGIGA